MNSVVKLVSKFIFDSKEHKIYLSCIMLVSTFTAAQFSNQKYTIMLLYTFTNKNFLVAILFPIFCLLTFQIFKYFNTNVYIFLRMTKRKNFLKTLILSIVFISFFLFIESVIISIIACNIIPHESFSFVNYMNYNTPDMVVLIASFVKLYLTLLSICLLSVTFNNYFSKNAYTIIASFLFIVSLYFLTRLITGNITVDTLNPAYHFNGYLYTTNIYDLLLSGLFYFPFVYTLLIILANRFINKSIIGV